jgi:hypothetical protein
MGVGAASTLAMPHYGFVADELGGTVSTIDVKSRTKHPLTSLSERTRRGWRHAGRRDAFITNVISSTASTVDVKTRTRNLIDIPVGEMPIEVAITPCRRWTGRAAMRQFRSVVVCADRQARWCERHP